MYQFTKWLRGRESILRKHDFSFPGRGPLYSGGAGGGEGGLNCEIVKPPISLIEEKAMSLSIFYYCSYDFLCCCRNFNPTLRRLSAFLLSCVVVSRPCRCWYFFCCIYAFLCRNFNPSLCRFSPFLLFYVFVSRPCRLSELPLAGPLGNDSKGPGSLKGKREKTSFFPRRLLAIFSSQKNSLL